MSNSALLLASDEIRAPFIESAQAVFSMMLGCNLKAGECIRSGSFKSSHDISGIIGFSGALQGTVVISIDQEVAFSAAEAFLGERPTAINEEVVDMVGELANMIGGNAKERMTVAGILLGLPTVISGKGHSVSFEPGSHIEMIPFETPWGPMTIEIGLRLPSGR